VAKYKTIAQFRAENEALRASLEGAQQQLAVAQREIHRMAEANIAQVRDRSSINGLRALAIEQRKLVDAGVPCFIQSGVIKHQYTKAILFAP